MSEQIARTILEQLGNRRFQLMTGAKCFTFGESDLTFALPIGKAGVCRIELDHVTDTYTVIFYKREQWKTVARNGKRTELSRFSLVYFDHLRELFERETGLALTLGKVVFV